MSAINKYIRYGSYTFSNQKRFIKLHTQYCRPTGIKKTLFQNPMMNSVNEMVSRNISTQIVKLQSINLFDDDDDDDDDDGYDNEEDIKTELGEEDVTGMSNSFDMSTFHKRVKLHLKAVKQQKKIFGPVLTNVKAAKSIVTQIMDSRSTRHAPILELNCGPGILTKTFLEHGVSKVVGTDLVDNKNIFSPFLCELQNSFGDNRFNFYHCHHKGTLYLSGTLYQERKTEKVVKEGKRCSVVIIAPTLYYRNQLANFCIYKIKNDLFYSQKRVDFYVTFDDMTMVDLNNVNHELYRTEQYPRKYQTLILHLFFDITPIGKYPSHLFLSAPRMTKTNQKAGYAQRHNPKVLHLVKLTLKKDHMSIIPPGQYWSFILVVRLISRNSDARIIPLLEDLVPNCGLQLLVEGFDMTERVIDLEPSRFIEVYKLLVSFPEFRNSPLQTFLEARRKPGDTVIPIQGEVRKEQEVDLDEEDDDEGYDDDDDGGGYDDDDDGYDDEDDEILDIEAKLDKEDILK